MTSLTSGGSRSELAGCSARPGCGCSSTSLTSLKPGDVVRLEVDSGLLAPSEFNTFVMYLVEEQEVGGRQGTCRDTCHCNCNNDCCHDSHDDGRYGYNDGQTGHSGFNDGNGHSGYNDGQSGHSGYNDGLSGPTGNSGYNDGNSGFYDAPRESGYRTTPAPDQDKIIYITTPRQGALLDIENTDSVQFNSSHGEDYQ